jgi:hypothetical protein
VPFPNSTLETFRWIVRALWTEIFGFRFGYPIELVPEAGPRHSLHYYVFSERLFFDAMQLDVYGVPVQRSRRLGAFYNPAYVAWYGLMVLEQSLLRGGVVDDRFRIQVEWLLKNAVRQPDGAIVWPFPVDVREGRCTLRAPWISAMIQGLAISTLVRAHRQGWESDELIEICRAAVKVYGKDVDEGGVRTTEGRGALYEEYPAYPLPRVMDGFLFSLLGLYDFWVETGEAVAKERFQEGVQGLLNYISAWNYRDRWSWYGSHGYLCPPQYHVLNRLLVLTLARVTGEPLLTRYAELWDPAGLNGYERARLFVVFLFFKQWARIRALGRPRERAR